jgi:hypothetical protein
MKQLFGQFRMQAIVFGATDKYKALRNILVPEKA